MIARTLVFSAALLLALVAPVATRAAEIDLTGTLSGFTSPDNVYGPWRSLTLSARFDRGKDHIGIVLVDRADADGGGPTHSVGAVLDDTHDWSPTFFTYAALSAATGNLLPTRNAYLEGDVKLGRSLATVVGMGGGIVVNPDGTIQRYLNVGPTWYHNNMNVTLRWLPSFTTGRMGSSSALMTLANGAAGSSITTLTLLAGNEPPNGVVAAAIPGGNGQRVLLAGFDVKRWLNAKQGFHVGVELERLTDNTSGRLLYVRRGLSIGYFRDVGR